MSFRHQINIILNFYKSLYIHFLIFILQGIVGTPHSGKTALVNHFLTGAYSREDSPEGGRFKKQIVLDGQSYLLLLRDDGSVIPGKNVSFFLLLLIIITIK